MKLTKTFISFFENERAGSIVLLLTTVLSLVLANVGFHGSYSQIWETELGNHSITYWINDGLMTIFFLLIGLELEREIKEGELSKIKNAILPIFGALGGMVLPALIFLFFNFKTPTQNGAGVPMATDIAFAIGILSLLGKRVPSSIKVFLTALAVIDDLGAILVIAVFYTETLILSNLLMALGILVILFIFNKVKINNIFPYLIGGVFMWYFMFNSGVHATITGILLAFVIPSHDNKDKNISEKLQHFLHKPVAFIILPLFAMSNTGIVINGGWVEHLNHVNSIGILLGLIIGKPFGILLFSFLAVSLGFCSIPKDLKWKHIFGAGMLGGIGFTMSIFITLLAFDKDDPEIILSSKIAILTASFLAGISGYFWLKFTLKNKEV